MKKLLMVISLLVVLVAAVTGCGGAHRYDSRLTAADSLMQPNPDSALAIVEAVCPDSLPDESNRAYRNLLLTQARYRCYIVATSDSDINRALSYYRAHAREREKFTRAFIYQGAVMEELVHPDSAMFYYKHAEATAAPDDYFNLGYTKMRIATLYQDQLSQDSAAIIRLKDAIRYFKLVNDTNYLIICYGNLGSITGVRYPDSTEYYLTRAIELAQQLNSAKQYTYKSKLAGFIYYHDKDYPRANRLAMDVLQHGSEDCLEHQFYYYAAMTYLYMGQVDSAKYVLSKTPDPVHAVDSMNRYNMIAEIAKAENNHMDYGENAIKSKEMTLQILNESKEKELVETELKYKTEQDLSKEKNVRKRSNMIAATLVIITVLMAVAIWALRRRLIAKALEQRKLQDELTAAINALNEKMEHSDTMSATTSFVVKNRMEAFQELFDSIKFKPRKETHGKSRNVFTLRNILGSLDEHYVVMKVEPSDSFWDKLRLSVDGEFNGIVTYVEQHYPNLSTRDIKIICLLCTRISPQIMKLCMNLTTPRSASNYRSLIMKKLGLNMTFDDFISKYMKGELDQ